MFWDDRLHYFFLWIKAGNSDAYHLEKTIFKQTGKARKYFYNYLITYFLSLFHVLL